MSKAFTKESDARTRTSTWKPPRARRRSRRTTSPRPATGGCGRSSPRSGTSSGRSSSRRSPGRRRTATAPRTPTTSTASAGCGRSIAASASSRSGSTAAEVVDNAGRDDDRAYFGATVAYRDRAGVERAVTYRRHRRGRPGARAGVVDLPDRQGAAQGARGRRGDVADARGRRGDRGARGPVRRARLASSRRQPGSSGRTRSSTPAPGLLHAGTGSPGWRRQSALPATRVKSPAFTRVSFDGSRCRRSASRTCAGVSSASFCSNASSHLSVRPITL